MMADCFLTGEDFAYLSDVLSNWLAYGIGLGAVLWLLGQGVRFVIQFVRY